MQRSILEPLVRKMLDEEVAGYENYPWKQEGASRVARRIVEAIEQAVDQAESVGEPSGE